jgi:hypothetical protein
MATPEQPVSASLEDVAKARAWDELQERTDTGVGFLARYATHLRQEMNAALAKARQSLGLSVERQHAFITQEGPILGWQCRACQAFTYNADWTLEQADEQADKHEATHS